jgi:hypothetical protein
MYFDRIGYGIPAISELGLSKNDVSYCSGVVNDDGTRTCMPKYLQKKIEDKIGNIKIKDKEQEYQIALEFAKTDREIRKYYHEFFKISTDLAIDGPLTDKHINYIYDQWVKELTVDGIKKFQYSTWIPPDYDNPDFYTIVKNVPELINYIGDNCVWANPVNLQEEFSRPRKGLAHWTLLSIDTRSKPYQIAYFCSLGEEIPPQIINLISKIETEYKKRGIQTKFYPLNKIKHQKYGSSCGIYILYVIRCMIYKNFTAKDFSENKDRIFEHVMDEFRKYVFDSTYSNIVSENGSKSLLR